MILRLFVVRYEPELFSESTRKPKAFAGLSDGALSVALTRKNVKFDASYETIHLRTLRSAGSGFALAFLSQP
jgi:hypothetical protein